MKQAITDREVLQNIELKCGDMENGYSFNDITMNGRLVAKVYNTPEIKTREVVELICKAVNERQRLLDSNKELLEALEHWQKWFKSPVNSVNDLLSAASIFDKSKTAINNAKNLNK